MSRVTIIFDLDGTLTDYNAYVDQKAAPYFRKQYGWEPRCPEELEIENIFAIKTRLSEQGLSETQAVQSCHDILSKYWISFRFLQFSVFGRFRLGAGRYLRSLKKGGWQVEIHTSREKTCEKNIIGIIARVFTKLQCLSNGIIPCNRIFFYENDVQKLQGIRSRSPMIVFEDKSSMIEGLNSYSIKTICLNGKHNKDVKENGFTKRMDGFTDGEPELKTAELLGREKWKYCSRAAESDAFFQKILWSRRFILRWFTPLVLHRENLTEPQGYPVIYAPNHRSTLDPVVITALVGVNIHWAALKRFFTAEDSIFNNSKNILLCRFTSKLFYKLEYFPIVRKSDDENASNYASIRDMCGFLKANQAVGIFAEGTTRRPKDSDFGTFDPTFLHLAKRTKALVQPITIYWYGEGKRVAIHVGEAFAMVDMKEGEQRFLRMQREGLAEIKKVLGED